MISRLFAYLCRICISAWTFIKDINAEALDTLTGELA